MPQINCIQLVAEFLSAARPWAASSDGVGFFIPASPCSVQLSSGSL